MELRHLWYFVAVAEDLSFRRAAHRLHVSHPSLSQRISNLARRLVETPDVSVLLLEAGGTDDLANVTEAGQWPTN